MTYEPNDVPLYTFYFNRTIIAVIALMPIPLASNMAINHGMPGIVLIGVLALAITMLSLSFRKAMVIYEDRIEYRSSPIYALKTCYKSAITQIEVRKNMLLIHEGKHTTKMMLNLYKAKDKQQLEIYLMQLNNQSQQQEDNEERLAQASLKAKLATLK